jgi:hypothetical protein
LPHDAIAITLITDSRHFRDRHARPCGRVPFAGGVPKSQRRAMATSADSLVAFGQQHVTRGLGRLTEAVMAKGEGSYVSFEDGRSMLDFSCGIGVTNLGELLLHSQVFNSDERKIRPLSPESFQSCCGSMCEPCSCSSMFSLQNACGRTHPDTLLVQHRIPWPLLAPHRKTPPNHA